MHGRAAILVVTYSVGRIWEWIHRWGDAPEFYILGGLLSKQKRISSNKFVEWKALDLIGPIVHEMKFIWREISKDDQGYDGEIEIVDLTEDGKGFFATGAIIKAQVKSGKSYILNDSASEFSVRIDDSDVEYWRTANVPVVYIIYNPHDSRVYWKEVKSLLETDFASKPYRLEFNKDLDELNIESHTRLKSIAGIVPSRIARGVSERLYSNLLPVLTMPNKIYTTPIELTVRDIFAALPSRPAPFVLYEKRLLTFEDLTDDRSSFADLIDCHDVEVWSSEEMSRHEDLSRVYIWLLNECLREHFRDTDIRYDKKYSRFYFMKRSDLEEVKKDWHNVITKRLSNRLVLKKYRYGKDIFWRHIASEITFKKLDENWYIQIVPRYHWTVDGFEYMDGKSANKYSTGVQSREFNQAVMYQVLFWSHILAVSRNNPRISIKCGYNNKQLIEADRVPVHCEADFGIRQDPPKEIEAEKPPLPSLFEFENTELDHDD